MNMDSQPWDAIRDFGAVAIALTAIATVAAAIIKWGVIKPLKNYIDHATIQLKPNHGSHLADAINRTDTRVDEIATGQTQLLNIMLEHLRTHGVTPPPLAIKPPTQ